MFKYGVIKFKVSPGHCCLQICQAMQGSVEVCVWTASCLSIVCPMNWAGRLHMFSQTKQPVQLPWLCSMGHCRKSCHLPGWGWGCAFGCCFLLIRLKSATDSSFPYSLFQTSRKKPALARVRSHFLPSSGWKQGHKTALALAFSVWAMGTHQAMRWMNSNFGTHLLTVWCGQKE